jgi:predicted ABC-type ATPase
MSPSLHILAGPNGAGKTTFANEFLPDYVGCLNFVNADLIAKGLAPFNPQSAAIKAGRLMLEQISHFADQKVDFGFETTLSGKSNIRVFNDIKAKG